MAVSLEIGELSSYIPIFSLKNLFSEPAFPIAQERLNAFEMAGGHDVWEAVAVDVTAGQGTVAYTGPGWCNLGEGFFAAAHPNVERRFRESRRGNQIKPPIAVEVNNKRAKAPFFSLPKRDSLNVAG
jgi:hypothetical protein